jgi:hypothetical protein
MLYKQDDRIAKRLAEAAENDPKIKEIFDRRMNPDICKFEISDEDSGIHMVGCFPKSPIIESEPFLNIITKIKPPSFLNENQKEFYMNRFPLKDKNE